MLQILMNHVYFRRALSYNNEQQVHHTMLKWRWTEMHLTPVWFNAEEGVAKAVFLFLHRKGEAFHSRSSINHPPAKIWLSTFACLAPGTRKNCQMHFFMKRASMSKLSTAVTCVDEI